MDKIIKKLDLGCGHMKTSDSIGVDLKKLPGVDYAWDLNQTPYPEEWAKSEYYDEVFINHTLEHLDDIVPVIKECYRILKPGGKLCVAVPFYAHRTMYSDPTHKHFFAYCSLDFFAKDSYSRQFSNFVDYYPEINFLMVRPRINFVRRSGPKGAWFLRFLDPVVNKFPIIYERFFAFILPAKELYYELIK